MKSIFVILAVSVSALARPQEPSSEARALYDRAAERFRDRQRRATSATWRGRKRLNAMLLEVKVPEVGESITEGILAEWSKADGDWVEAEEPLLVLETDKITMTVDAEASGQLEILVAEGATVQVGQVVATIDPEAEPRTVPAGEKAVAGAEEAPRRAAEYASAPPPPAVAAPLSHPPGWPRLPRSWSPSRGFRRPRSAWS